MQLGFDEDQEMLRKTIHDFMDRECPRTVQREVEKGELGYSPELWQKLAGMGLVGLLIPEEYGGSGGDLVDAAMFYEEMGRALCITPHLPSVLIAGQALARLGTEEQKRSWLPRVAMGEAIMAFASEEPDADYDAPPQSTTAQKHGNAWVLNGTKLFVDYAPIAQCVLVSAASNTGGAAGTTLFLVDPKATGVRITPVAVISGDKVAEVEFDQVMLPDAARLGSQHEAGPVLDDLIQQARVAVSALAVGGAQGALNLAVQYAKERVQFGRPIGGFQAIQFKLANVAMDVEGARWLAYEAAWRAAQGKPFSLEAARAKAFAGEAFRKASVEGIQVMGAYGYSEEYDMQLYYRRARACEVTSGDADHNRELVAQHELG